MGGVEVAVAFRVVRRAPRAGAVLDAVHLRTQLVDVGALGVEEFAEHAGAAETEVHTV